MKKNKGKCNNIVKGFYKNLGGCSHNRQVNGYNHVFNESYPVPAARIPCWNNVHGYAAPDGYDYYACVDMRVMGFRVQNLIVRCKTENMLNSWIESMKTDACIERIKNGPHQSGSDLDTCWTFNTTDGDSKDYNINASSDFYADLT